MPKIKTVYSKSSIYEKDSKQIKNFFSAISDLLANREKAGLEVESAWDIRIFTLYLLNIRMVFNRPFYFFSIRILFFLIFANY